MASSSRWACGCLTRVMAMVQRILAGNWPVDAKL
jgi:hypothetical protein